MLDSLDYFRKLLEWKTKDGIYALNVYKVLQNKSIMESLLYAHHFCEDADALIDAFNITDETTIEQLYKYEWNYRLSNYHIHDLTKKAALNIIVKNKLSCKDTIELLKREIVYVKDIGRIIKYFDEDLVMTTVTVSGELNHKRIRPKEYSREFLQLRAIDSAITIPEPIKPRIIRITDPLDINIKMYYPDLVVVEELCKYHDELFDNPKFTCIKRICHEIIVNYKPCEVEEYNEELMVEVMSGLENDELLLFNSLPMDQKKEVEIFVDHCIPRMYEGHENYINHFDLQLLHDELMKCEPKHYPILLLLVEVTHAIRYNHKVRPYDYDSFLKSIAEMRGEQIISIEKAVYHYFGSFCPIVGFNDGIEPISKSELLNTLR